MLPLLARTAGGQPFGASIVVVDNDAAESAREVVDSQKHKTGLPLRYEVEPRQNIALARNRAVAAGHGEFIAFIDDDEFPEEGWLRALHSSLTASGADAVLGPVLPAYEESTPAWVRKGGFYERPRYLTGTTLSWEDCRTGNVLFRRRVLDRLQAPFLPQFQNGGEDQDFFRRAGEQGAVFRWCDEAIVYERVPPSRCRRSVLLKRALLRGKNSLRHEGARARNLLKSMVILPIYLCALPLLFVVGHHLFMRYLVKTCDHLGRLLACFGLNPVNERMT